MIITIRHEKLSDIQSIHDLTKEAFLEAPHTDHTEQFIVAALRNSDAMTLSLVAERESEVVGHVALSRVAISDGATDWYGLGPISVLPTEQGKGIGSQLMLAALDELELINAKGCVLLGDPGYYHRFGFKSIDQLVLTGVPAEYFQAFLIQGDYPKGVVEYHESFNATQ